MSAENDERQAIIFALLNRAEQGGDDLEEDLDKIAAQFQGSDSDCGKPSDKPSPFKDRKSLK